MQRIVDLFFPARCACCGVRILKSKNPYICPKCSSKIESLVPWQICACCGAPQLIKARYVDEQHHLCGECLRHPPAYSLARSLFFHKEPLKTLVHDLKYRQTSTALAAIKTLLPVSLADFSDCDLILPVPLHEQRLRQRGFNQSLLLAKAIFSHRSIEIRSDLLKRVRNTAPQTTMSGVERRQNLSKAFSVNGGASFFNRRVCLVDDVFTTGSTVNECSLILSSCGAKNIKILTLSRSPLG